MLEEKQPLDAEIGEVAPPIRGRPRHWRWAFYFAVIGATWTVEYELLVRPAYFQIDCLKKEKPSNKPFLNDEEIKLLREFLDQHKNELPPKTLKPLEKVLALHRAEHASGKILSPTEGQKVGARILVEVEVADIPRGYHVWIAVERGNSVWLKEPEISVSGAQSAEQWSETVFEGGTPGIIRLSLLLVPPEGQEAIQRWFQNARSGDYSGMSLEEISATRLHVVENLQFQ